MEITWKITKKRGNWRPFLKYTMTETEEEVDLCLPSIYVKTTMPKVLRRSSVFPGKEEREEGWVPGEFEEVATPLSGDRTRRGSLYLPWRPGANPEYPEVEESFKLVQEEYEKRLRVAYDSAPFEYSGKLSMTPETKKHIAPGVIAKKMLKAVGEKE